MSIEPLYRADVKEVAYHLRYSWTAWPVGSRWRALPMEDLLNRVAPLWEQDGLRMLEYRTSQDKLQVTFSTTPGVSPIALTRLAKGRLQHAMREADAGFEAMMRQFTVVCPDVDLAVPTMTARGRYWYNLHVVLVVVERRRIVDPQRLGTIRDWCFRIATKKGHQIAALSVMPDHLHVAMRGNPDHSPQEIALAFQNNLAYAVGQTRIWNDGFYVGTFGEYDMQAIRQDRDSRPT